VQTESNRIKDVLSWKLTTRLMVARATQHMQNKHIITMTQKS